MRAGSTSYFLALLDRPAEAIEAASTAYAHLDPAYVARYVICQIRLGHALVLSKEISEDCTVPKLDAWPADQVFFSRARLLAGTR
jgi:hypothetical protein